MMPWIILSPIGLVLYAIYICIAIISLSNLVSIVSNLLGWLLWAYSLLVVAEYCAQLLELSLELQKSRIRETLNLWTNADSSTYTKTERNRQN